MFVQYTPNSCELYEMLRSLFLIEENILGGSDAIRLFDTLRMSICNKLCTDPYVPLVLIKEWKERKKIFIFNFLSGSTHDICFIPHQHRSRLNFPNFGVLLAKALLTWLWSVWEKYFPGLSDELHWDSLIAHLICPSGESDFLSFSSHRARWM